MKFIGVDLAWSPRNNSGIALIEGTRRGGKLRYAELALSDDEITNMISKEKGDALVAIDAPLIVPNKTGRRLAEEVVGNLFRRYDAGAHPANRMRLGEWSGGKIRGEEIVRQLEHFGFIHDPNIARYESCRKVFEVYPHPSMVVIFGLNHILQYKARPNRPNSVRVREFKRYESLLQGLSSGKPRLEIPEGLLGRNISSMGPSELKRHEDALDAIFCAYIAYYCWSSPEKCMVLGNMRKGYILTPVFDYMNGEQRRLV